ncbi:MAG: clostripain-related cysteine peptidase [Pyrinomonadaceae bacterium]
MSNKEWTIMIYLAGDNNLSVDMAHAMEQIKGIAGEEANGTNLFVYYDGNSASIPTLYCDFSDSANPKHVRSFKVPNKLYRVEPKRNENAADYRSVLNFVDWCVNKVEVGTGDQVRRGRRADKYGLIFSGHSLGFNDPGLFKDETSGKTLTMEDMFMLIDRLTRSKDELTGKVHDMDLEYEKNHRFDSDPDADRRRSTVMLGQPLDILGFDSCVMGMLEVGFQFKNAAKTMIASEGSVPSAGWTYAKILGSLARDFTPLDDNEVAARFVTKFIKSQDSFTVGGASVDMAAWDMAKLDGLNTEFEKLAKILLECFDDPKSAVYRHMERAMLQVHWKCQSYMHDQNVDIGDFCELLRAECVSLTGDLSSDDSVILGKVQEACDRVLAELNKVVILSGFSGGEYQYSNGISLFFPWSYVTYKASEKYYKRLEFVDKGAGRSWSRFLQRYLSEVTLRPFEDPEVLVPQRSLAAASGAASVLTSKHRYSSFQYNEDERSLGLGSLTESKMPGELSSKMPGEQSSKMPGEQSSKMPGEQSSKMPGEQSSKMPGEQSSKMPGEQSSKMPGEQSSKMPGEQSSKMPGEQSSKMPGEQSSKMPGEQSSKMPGEQSSKMPGEQSSKMPGEQSPKMPRREDSKMPGREDSKLGGGGSNALFSSLKHFKNIESRWNISGFTKKPAESESDTEMAKGSHS